MIEFIRFILFLIGLILLSCSGTAGGLLFLFGSVPLFRGGGPGNQKCGDEKCSTKSAACVLFNDDNVAVKTCQELFPECERVLDERNTAGTLVQTPAPPPPASTKITTPAPLPTTTKSTPAPNPNPTPASTKQPPAVPPPTLPVAPPIPVIPVEQLIDEIEKQRSFLKPVVTTDNGNSQLGAASPDLRFYQIDDNDPHRQRLKLLCCQWANLEDQCDCNPEFMKRYCSTACGTPGCHLNFQNPTSNCPTRYNATHCGPKIPTNGRPNCLRKEEDISTSASFGSTAEALVNALASQISDFGEGSLNQYELEPSAVYDSYDPFGTPTAPDDQTGTGNASDNPIITTSNQADQQESPFGIMESNSPLQVFKRLTNCQDKHTECSQWGSEGECKRNPWWMGANCCETCGAGVLPNNACPDIYGDQYSCGYWASVGECTKSNSAWMLFYCSGSCQNCGAARILDPSLAKQRARQVLQIRNRAARRMRRKRRLAATAKQSAKAAVAAQRVARLRRLRATHVNKRRL